MFTVVVVPELKIKSSKEISKKDTNNFIEPTFLFTPSERMLEMFPNNKITINIGTSQD